MSKKSRINLDIQPSLNRGVIYTAFPIGKPIQFIILHHKQTPALQFQIESNNEMIKEKNISIKMYRNLDNCCFCNTFFDTVTRQDSSCDYRSKFSGVKGYMYKYVISFMKERLDLRVSDDKKSPQNYLYIRGWKIHGIEDDLIFFHVERRCYNNVTRTNVVRTAGLQFATQNGIDKLKEYEENTENFIRKVKDDDNIPDFFSKDYEDY